MKSFANFKVQPAMIAIIGFTYFLIAITVLYVLNPAYSLVTSFAGNYDLGSCKFPIASTFFSLGFGSLTLSFGLYQRMAHSAHSWFGLILLSIWGLGMLVAGVFPANEGGSTVPHMATVFIAGIFPVETQAYPETTFSFIHIFALILSFLILTLGTISLSWRFKQAEEWRPIRTVVLILSLIMCVASILFFSTLLFPGFQGYARVDPIVFIMIGFVIGVIWLLLVTFRLCFLSNKLISM